MMMVVVLVVFWLLAWGEFSLANLLSGLLVAAFLLLVVRRPTPSASRVRLKPVGVIKLIFHILSQLVISTALVAREVVSRQSRVRTGVIAHQMQDASPEVISTLSNAIALTPGTMTVEATTDPAVVYVHFLLLDDIDRARRDIALLERLVINALGRGDAEPVGETT